MQDLITIKEAAEILDVTLSTVSYYVRTKKLASVESDQRTAHRKPRRMIERAEVLRFKTRRDEQPAFPSSDTGASA